MRELTTKLAWMAAALLIAGCGGNDSAGPGPEGPDTIARTVFMDTFVDLRMEALDNSPRVITPEEREAVLEAHGVTEDDLQAFVEFHGDDLEYMRDLWADIEARVLSRLDPEADTAGAQR